LVRHLNSLELPVVNCDSREESFLLTVNEVCEMGKIRVGLLGFGFIGGLHSRAVTNCPDTELSGVWTLPGKTLEDFEARFPGKRVYSSPEEMAADPAVDAVVVGLPNKLHFPQAKLFLESGKHVLVEKPMAMDLVEANEMAAMASRLGLALMVGHMWRFDREFLAVKELLDSGRLGEVVKTKGYGIHMNWGPAGWFVERELAGGGALVDMGVHAIDSVRFLLGDPEPASVYAVIGTHFGDYDVDDTGVLVINWKNGVVSMVESGWWHPHMDGVEASTQVFAKKGYARVFPTMGRIAGEERPWRPRFPVREDHCDQHIYDGQMQEFADAINEGRQPAPGTPEGLVVMKICDAAYRSAAENRVIEL